MSDFLSGKVWSQDPESLVAPQSLFRFSQNLLTPCSGVKKWGLEVFKCESVQLLSQNFHMSRSNPWSMKVEFEIPYRADRRLDADGRRADCQVLWSRGMREGMDVCVCGSVTNARESGSISCIRFWP
jgi:hypothetical protein